MQTVLSPVWALKMFPSVLLGVLSLDVHSFLTCKFWSVLHWKLKEDSLQLPGISAQLSLSLSLSCEFWAPWPPWTPSPISSMQNDCQTPPGFPFPALQPGNSVQAVSWGNRKFLLICFPCLTDHCPALPAVQSPKTTVAHILFRFLVVSGGRVNLVPVTPSWLEAEDFYLSSDWTRQATSPKHEGLLPATSSSSKTLPQSVLSCGKLKPHSSYFKQGSTYYRKLGAYKTVRWAEGWALVSASKNDSPRNKTTELAYQGSCFFCPSEEAGESGCCLWNCWLQNTTATASRGQGAVSSSEETFSSREVSDWTWEQWVWRSLLLRLSPHEAAIQDWNFAAEKPKSLHNCISPGSRRRPLPHLVVWVYLIGGIKFASRTPTARESGKCSF